jgi:hypothetical protein
MLAILILTNGDYAVKKYNVLSGIGGSRKGKVCMQLRDRAYVFLQS